MNRFFRLVALFLLLASPSAPAFAQGQTPDAFAQNDGQALERWQRMTPEEKQQMRERFERWKTLPQERKDELRKNFDDWRRMPPEEKAVARKNFERWQKLPPEERERLRETWQRWRQLPPEKRQALRERFEHLSPEEKQRMRESFTSACKGSHPRKGSNGGRNCTSEPSAWDRRKSRSYAKNSASD